ncbi:MAG: glycosyltransferase [Bacillota bacterium]
MDILYDLTPAQPYATGTKFHGGAEYCISVFHALIKYINEHHCNINIETVYNKHANLESSIIDFCKEYNVGMFHANTLGELQSIINNNDYRLFFSALPSNWWYTGLILQNTKLIYTIHGLRKVEMPTDKYELKYLSGLKKKLKWCFKQINPENYIEKEKKHIQKLMKLDNSDFITVSNHTKYQLINTFPSLSEKDIKVFYSPPKNLSRRNDSLNINILQSLNLSKQKYLLLISGNRWVKNNYRAIKAIDQLLSSRPYLDFKVVLTGVDKENIYNVSNKKRFVFVNYVHSTELDILYKNSFIFLYPSLNEGFGYPPVEAMKYGVPCVVSATSSIPEVCGDGALYFNPYLINEMINKVLMLYNNSSIYKLMQSKAYKRYKEVTDQQNKMLINMVEYLINNAK